MKNIVISKASKEDLLKLLTEDFTWEATGRFDVVRSGDGFSLIESKLSEPVLRGENEVFHNEIKEYAEMARREDALMLIALVDDQAVGYVSAFVEEWKDGKVINADGVLVAKNYRGMGVAKALMADLINRAKEMPDCRGIMIEMDTEKYEANKLLLSMGFEFAGSRFYIRSNQDPKPGSKEAVYFYYKVNR